MRFGVGVSISKAFAVASVDGEWQLEASTDLWLLEDGSGAWSLE